MEQKRDIAEFYDEKYRDNPNLFAGPLIGPIAQLGDFVAGKKVLDVGAGNGRHALYFAECGAEVLALDVSSVGLEALARKASERGLSIATQVFDIRKEAVPDGFDAMVCTFVFHHLNQTEVEALLGDMQKHTNPSGYHAIACFLNEGNIAESAKQTAYLPAPNALKEKYEAAGWEVLAYEEVWRKTVAKLPNNEPGKNKAAAILARKPLLR